MLAAGIGTAGGGMHVWFQGRNLAGAGASYPIVFQPLGGNVGIGTSSPGELLHLSKATYPFIKLTETTANTSGQFGYDSPAAEWRLRTLTNTPLTFGTNDTEFMRITYGGSSVATLVIGSTVTSRAGAGISILNKSICISTVASTNSGGTHHEFVLPNGQIVGQITTNSSNTTYSTSSDYRLKSDYKDLKALELIDNLKIYQYKWKIDDSIGYGVMAHELQEYLPYAVTGKKDGEEMQAVDYSKLAPIAIAGVKQLHKLFESHAEKIARLESEVLFLKSNIA
jgi:hypothetical protein